MTEEWLKRNQKTIDDEIRKSDVFIVIFKNTIGNYTFHEFEVARDCYSKTNGKPRIYPYISNELMLTDLLRSRGALNAAEEYPDGLDAVFTRWFSWFFSDSDFRSFWRPAISCILGAPAPLPAETLRRVMHWGENELADFRARLKVLLRAEKNEFDEETLVFDHAFIREWLTRGKGENVYFCSPQDGAEKLAAELFAIFESGPEELSFWEAVHLMDFPLKKSQREKAVESLALDDQVSDAGDYCGTWGKYDQAEEIYDKALPVAEERDKKLANEDSQRNLAFYLKRKSDMLLIRGKIVQSVELEEKAFSIVQDIAEKNPTDKNRRNLSISYKRIGDRLEEQGKLNGALDMFRKSLSIAEKLSLELGTPQSQRDLSVSYNCVGGILQKQGDFTDALEMCRKSLAICEELSLELGTPQFRRDLAVSYNNIGDTLRKQGDFTGALEMCRKGLAIDEKLSLELDTPSAYRDVMLDCTHIVSNLFDTGKYDAALPFAKEALVIGEALAAQLDTDAAHEEAEKTRSNLKSVEARCKNPEPPAKTDVVPL